MKFLDLQTQYHRIKPNVLTNIDAIFESGQFIMGKAVEELEDKLSHYVNRKYTLTCSSGTDALLISLMALDITIGDAVFVPSFTFFATAEVVSLLGATPIFIEIEEDTFNIDCNHLNDEIKRVINENILKPRAIIPVDLFGLIANFDEIMDIAQKYDLKVIEDAAQSFGASSKDKKSCSFGHISTTSFYPTKPLACYGDGGALFTDDKELFEKMTLIRIHGQGKNRYIHQRLGLTGRLDTIQAAILLEKLKILDEEIKLRNQIANIYSDKIQNLKTPFIPENNISAYAQYSVLTANIEQRKSILEYLNHNNIPTAIYYPIPLHKQEIYKTKYQNIDLPITEATADRIFSLPMHPYLKEEEINNIIEAINKFTYGV